MKNITKKIFSSFIIVTIIMSLFVNVTMADSEDYEAVNVDKNFTRFELIDKNFGVDSTREFQFTPAYTGDYAFYYGNMSYEGSTKPTIQLQVLKESTPIDLEIKVSNTAADQNLTQALQFGSAPFSSINASTVAADGANGSWKKTDGSLNTLTSYQINVSKTTDYVRIGDKLTLHAALEKGTTYTISLYNSGDVPASLDYIDVRSLLLPLEGKDVQISLLDFSDYRSFYGTGSNNGPYPLQNLTCGEPQPEFAENYDIIGDYQSGELSSPDTAPRFIRRGVPIYTFDVKVPGKYTFTSYVRTNDVTTAQQIEQGKFTPELSIAVRIAKVNGGVANDSLIATNKEWGGVRTNTTDEADGYKYKIKEQKVYSTGIAHTVELEVGTYNLYQYHGSDTTTFYGLTVDYEEPESDTYAYGRIEIIDGNYVPYCYINNNLGAELPMTVILASYDENNVMKLIEPHYVVVSDVPTIVDELTLPTSGSDKARLFVWSGTDCVDFGQISYCDSIVVNNE